MNIRYCHKYVRNFFILPCILLSGCASSHFNDYWQENNRVLIEEHSTPNYEARQEQHIIIEEKEKATINDDSLESFKVIY